MKNKNYKYKISYFFQSINNYIFSKFSDDETSEEYDLKMKIFEIYNARLDERISRK